MTTTFLPRYADVIRSMSDADIENECLWPDKLLMVEGYNRRSPMKLVVAYAPFDHINEQAQVVIVGLTPGETQMRLALHEARRALKDGEDFSGVIRRAKKHASFGGDMRAPLIQLLDFIGVNRLVGRATSASLWDTGEDLAHFTSCLRYPTFRQAKKRNYGGSPMIRTTDVLRNELERCWSRKCVRSPGRRGSCWETRPQTPLRSQQGSPGWTLTVSLSDFPIRVARIGSGSTTSLDADGRRAHRTARMPRRSMPRGNASWARCRG